MTHERAPWTDVTFVGVYHDDPDRVRRLLEYVRPWFTNLFIGVQTDHPGGDPTESVAARFADRLLVEPVQGFAEPTLSNIIQLVPTQWSFVVSADEWPTTTLLNSFDEMVYLADHGDDYSTIDGFWIRFLSSIEGNTYASEQDNHLRLFRTRYGWPRTMHSRPHVANATFWPPEKGQILHERSLDEMMRDYLRYLSLSGRDGGWIAHNKLMMHDACTAISQTHGWPYVQQFSWWSAVNEAAFTPCNAAGRCVAGGGYLCR